MGELKPNPSVQVQAVRLFVKPGETHELRRWGKGARWVNVNGSDDDATIRAAIESLGGSDVHMTINPVRPDRISAGNEKGYSRDSDVVRRRWLVLDFDVQGRDGASSTDAERVDSYCLAGECLDFLLASGLPEESAPTWIDSGNGWRLHFRVDLANDDASKGLVKRFIKALAARFDTDKVKIDQNLYVASKLCRLPGCVVAKGDDTPDRPHRTSGIHLSPDSREPVPLAFLELIAGPPPEAAPKPEPTSVFVRRAMTGRLLDAYFEGAIRRQARQLSATTTNRNEALNLSAFSLGTLCGAVPGRDHEATDALRSAAEFLEIPRAEIDYHLPRSFEEGKAKPRRLPDRILTVGEPVKPKAPRAEPTPAVPSDPEPPPADPPAAPADEPKIVANFYLATVGKGEKESEVPMPFTAAEIAELVGKAIPGDWPRRVGGRLFATAPDGEIFYLDSPARHFAYLIRHASVQWAKGRSMVSQEQYHQYRTMTAIRYRGIETSPHWPPLPEVYYHHPAIPAGGDGSMLRRLVAFFNPLTPLDRDLIEAMILTLFWGGDPGKRPAFLIVGPERDGEGGRGVGKSTMPMMLATHLLDGFVDVGSDESFDLVKSRLLSTEEGRKRVVIIDNLKSYRFSNAALESAITSPLISGKAMYVGEVQRPNTLVWIITANGAALSKDLSQRTVEIRIDRPAWDPTWESRLESFIRGNRLEILADVRERLAEPSRLTQAASRWAAWEHDVLGKFDRAAELQRLVVDRRKATDTDDQEQGIVRDFLVAKIRDLSRDPESDSLFFPAAIVPDWACEALRRKMGTRDANSHLKTLGIPEMEYGKSNGVRGWFWRGARAGSKKAEHISDTTANPFVIRSQRAAV